MRATKESLNSPRTWLVALLLLAWVLRLFHIGAMSIWWDESLSYERARHDVAAIISGVIQIQNQTTHDLHPPLYFLLLHFSILAFGASEFSLRFLSTCSNLITLALLYPTARLLARVAGVGRASRIGALAVLLGTLSPFFVWYSQEARPYALVLLFSLLATFTLLKMMVDNSRPHFYFLAMAAMLFTHYLSFVILPFHAAALVLFGTKKRWRLLAVALGAGFLAAVALLAFITLQPSGSDLGAPAHIPMFIILRDILNSSAVGVTADLDRVAVVDLALLGLWILGLAATSRPARRDLRVALLLLSYVLLPPLALEAASDVQPLYMNSRHLITISPAFYLGIAFCIDSLLGRASDLRLAPLARVAPAALGLLGLGIITFGALYSLNNLYFNPAYAKDDNRGWAEFLRTHLRAGDFLILDSPQAETLYRYYGPPKLKWISLPNYGYSLDEQSRRDARAVGEAFQSNARIWFLQILLPLGDPNGHILDLLQRRGQSIDRVLFSGTSSEIILQQFIPGSSMVKELPASARPTAVTFGQNLQLVGFDAPGQLPAGARGVVKLYWRLTSPSGEDYGVSLRVVDDKGVRRGQSDALAVGNEYPSSKWTAGTIVFEAHDLPVNPEAPAGSYHIELSVYHSLTDRPLQPTISGSAASDAAVLLSGITVTRPLSQADPQ